jgi:hypothetical protein
MRPHVLAAFARGLLQPQSFASGGKRLRMEMIEGWNGASACALQAALRMSNEAFAVDLGVSVRTVAGWHQKPETRPRRGKRAGRGVGAQGRRVRPPQARRPHMVPGSPGVRQW